MLRGDATSDWSRQRGSPATHCGALFPTEVAGQRCMCRKPGGSIGLQDRACTATKSWPRGVESVCNSLPWCRASAEVLVRASAGRLPAPAMTQRYGVWAAWTVCSGVHDVQPTHRAIYQSRTVSCSRDRRGRVEMVDGIVADGWHLYGHASLLARRCNDYPGSSHGHIQPATGSGDGVCVAGRRHSGRTPAGHVTHDASSHIRRLERAARSRTPSDCVACQLSWQP